MDIFSVTVSYHPVFNDPNGVPLIIHSLYWSEELALQRIEELREPHYCHAYEILKLYKQDERGYLLKTAKNRSTLDFLSSNDYIECETEEEIIEEIIRFEIFDYDIKPGKLHIDSPMIYSDKVSPFY
jgi:uncharacterized protein Smg (DUF494 family)